MLSAQNILANKYGELKRRQKEFKAKIAQITKDIQEEKSIEGELLEACSQLKRALSAIQSAIDLQKIDANQTEEENTDHQRQIHANRECLLKLQKYLDSLKG
jgi:peptidoglycan hydrolase CwlO-like protein